MSNNTDRLILVLPVLLMLLSGFVIIPTQSSDIHLTRFQLAEFINAQLIDAGLAISQTAENNFSDLSDEKFQKIILTVSCNVMMGYPNSKFMPDKPLTNIETLSYINSAVEIISEIDPEGSAINFYRMFGWQNLASNLAHGFSNKMMPNELKKPGQLTKKTALNKIRAMIGNNTKLSVSSSISVKDSVTSKPIADAYIVISNQIAKTDENGFALFDIIKTDDSQIELFAVAEGYKPLSLKRDSRFNTDFDILLNPINTNLTITALYDQKPLKSFWVTINNKPVASTNNGKASIKNLKPGYYNVRVLAEGYLGRTTQLKINESNRQIAVQMQKSSLL